MNFNSMIKLDLYYCQMASPIYAPMSYKTFISSPVTLSINPNAQTSVPFNYTITDDIDDVDFVFSNIVYSGTKPFVVSLPSKLTTFYLIANQVKSPVTLNFKNNGGNKEVLNYTIFLSFTMGAIDQDGICNYYSSPPSKLSDSVFLIFAIVLPIVVFVVFVILAGVYSFRYYQQKKKNAGSSSTNGV